MVEKIYHHFIAGARTVFKCFENSLIFPISNLFKTCSKSSSSISVFSIPAEIVNAAVSLIIKAALLASRFSGRTRKRNLKKISKMDVDEKDKEVIFLRDKVDRQQLQTTEIVPTMKKRRIGVRW
jgi:hypothetical protein